MGISAADDMLKDNPHIERRVNGAPGLVGGTGDRTNGMVGSRKSYQKYQRQIQPLPLRTLTERRMQNPLR